MRGGQLHGFSQLAAAEAELVLTASTKSFESNACPRQTLIPIQNCRLRTGKQLRPILYAVVGFLEASRKSLSLLVSGQLRQ